MTNLSDLFPAGAGKQVSFVADGAISAAGKPVILNSAGTVTQVGQSAASEVGVGTPVVFNSGTTQTPANTFDSTNNKIVSAYYYWTGSANQGTAIVGTVSGTAISFGTAAAMASSVPTWLSIVYDANAQKVVVSYRDAGNLDYGTSIVGTVSGTSISFGTPVVFASADSPNTSSVYDSSNSKVVIAYQDYPNSRYGTAIVGTVSGTSISFGSEVVFNAGESSKISTAYDSSNNKVVISCRDETSSVVGSAVVGTVSGTSISFGTKATFNSGGTSMIGSSFDTTANKVVFSYQDGTNSDYGTGIVGTVSGTSISFGTAAVFNAAATADTSCAYDPSADRVVISYNNSGNSNYGTVIAGAVSGTSISFNTAAVFESATTTGPISSYDSSAGKVVTTYQANDGKAVVLSASASNLTATNFIGISDAAISDTASGNVTIKGGIAATGLTSLTPGSDYYAQDDGTITTASAGKKIGKAMSATSINLEYQS